MHDDEEEIELGPYTGLHRVYDWLPYTFHRIQRTLKQEYDCRPENIWQGYKCNRRPGYVEIYRVIQNYDNKVVWDGVSLDTLRAYLAREDYPLHDEKSQCNQGPRNKGAENFLQAVNRIRDNKH